MLLVVGGDSEIGAATLQALQAAGKPAAATTRRPGNVAPGRILLDLAAPLDRWEPPAETGSACVCAAVARLSACAADPAGSARINVVQTVALIEKLLTRGIHVLFLSTNQVFDGSVPHVPADAAPAPVSEYGRQKARVEAVLRGHIARGAPLAILRLAKVISAKMPLIEDWAARLSAGRPIRAFNDMALAPTPANLAGAAIGALLEDRATGIFQLSGPRDVAYAELGRLLAAHLGAEPALVTETSVREAGLPAGAAPLNTTLDSTLLRRRYGFTVPDARRVVAWAAAAAANNGAMPTAADARA